MLVSQPSISTETEGPLGGLVCVLVGGGALDGINEGAVVAVIKGMEVEVAICGVGVALATPITTGVAVKTEGVFVGGRNGVGGLKGPRWMTQPLQADNGSIARIRKMVFFISSPPGHCIPLC